MRRFLERIRIGRYGALADFEVGPLGPGLNIVYGPNEAGKSSIASFVGGVLFGWEEAYGVRNAYRPLDGERSGSLEFACVAADEDAVASVSSRSSVSRERNEDGLQGDGSVVSDVDGATYRTMFWLTSDELRSLRNTSDVAARLLAAGSATEASPAAAFVEVEQRIAALTAPAGEGSIPYLAAQLDDERALVSEEAERVGLLKQEDRERDELERGRASTAKSIDELNAQLATLHECRVHVQSADAQVQACDADLAQLRVERLQACGDEAQAADASLPCGGLDADTERALRDQLDDFADEQVRVTRAVEAAQADAASSEAAHEALLEVGDGLSSSTRGSANRGVQVVVSVLLPLVFAILGVLVLLYGRQTRSLSLTVSGVALMVAAVLLAAGALAVLLRPNKEAEALDARRTDAQWVMIQDRKKLESGMQAKELFEERLSAFLKESGLEAANGSIRQARKLLDETREARSRLSLAEQRKSSIELRISSLEDSRALVLRERARVVRDAGLTEEATLSQIDELIAQKTARRDALSEAFSNMNLRFGELDQRLQQARGDREFDQAKYRYHQTSCRLGEAESELIVLLLAKRMLEKSIAAWESRSQPEVYARASRLFSRMTGGAWTRMHMTAEGKLIAISAAGESREVHQLSLGTCQQLYLALRVAMLQLASGVGRSLPVIADDILVNFDDARRVLAAGVLADLSRSRQVIVFTCHSQTVEALCAADPGASYIAL